MRQLTLKELQQLSLEILKDVADFCEKNGIRYSLVTARSSVRCGTKDSFLGMTTWI